MFYKLLIPKIDEFTKFTFYFTFPITATQMQACKFAGMKNQPLIIRFITVLLLFTGYDTVCAQQNPTGRNTSYQLDTKQSKILWGSLKNNHYGFILLNSGLLNANAVGRLTDGRFSINMNEMRSTDHKDQKENDEIDELLRSDKYFSIAKYPVATMVVSTIIPTANPVEFKVSGKLTIKGTTNPIDIIAIIKPVKGGLKATASLKIDRMKWHITGKTENFVYGLRDNLQDAMIVDEIPIRLDLVFHQQ